DQGGAGQRPVRFVEGEDVGAGTAHQRDQAGVGDGRIAALDGHGAVVHEDVAGSVTADDDGVVGVYVPDDREHTEGGDGRRARWGGRGGGEGGHTGGADARDGASEEPDG